MPFQPYQHIEKLGTNETEGILEGEVYVFPKIDGTNGSVWYEDGEIKCGSRKRLLSQEADNAGFYAAIQKDQRYKNFFNIFPDHVLYGEWLVPHTLKEYTEDAWRKFYIFDVWLNGWTHYKTWSAEIANFNLDYIPAIGKLINPSEEQVYAFLDKNTYLIPDGKTIGEGIVIKNYDYQNNYGRQTWAKIVTNDFKAKHCRTMGPPEIKGKDIVERKIADEYLDASVIDKVKTNIHVTQGWSSKMIPQLLGRVWHDFVTEEIWEILKKLKNPKIDFAVLQRQIYRRTKELTPQYF